MSACDVASWTEEALDSAFLSCSVAHFGSALRSLHTSLQAPGDTLRTWGDLSNANRRAAWVAAITALSQLLASETEASATDNAACLAPSIEWATPRPNGLTFGTCAVIGSGAALRGRSLGPEIDANDVVVHVNNRPDPSDRHDMGSRTDILFTTPNAYNSHWDCSASEPFRPNSNCMLDVEYMHAGEDKCCSGDPCHYDVCSVRGVLFKNEGGEDACPTHIRRDLERTSSGSLISLGVAASFTGDLAVYFRRTGSPYHGTPRPGTVEHPGDPSTGLHAVITMAFACDIVTLYGFRGDATIDGHHGGYAGHSIAAEHVLLQDLANHTVAAEHFVEPAYYERWANVQLGYGSY